MRRELERLLLPLLLGLVLGLLMKGGLALRRARRVLDEPVSGTSLALWKFSAKYTIRRGLLNIACSTQHGALASPIRLGYF